MVSYGKEGDRMDFLRMICSFIWNCLTSFFGAVAAACFLAGAVLLAVELFLYRRKRKRQTRMYAILSESNQEERAGIARNERSQQGSVEAAYSEWADRDVVDTECGGKSCQDKVVPREKNRDTRRRIALITGASSGMGSVFARRIDETEKNIDEIWLVARRRERLEDVARQLAHPARIIPMDLTDPDSIRKLEILLSEGKSADEQENDAARTAGADEQENDAARTAGADRQEGVEVGLFVNCAGYAKIGNYEKVSHYDSDRMIDLNCKAAVNTTLAVLPYMRAGDRIMELCSTSSFQPVTHLNLYAAGKAFLYSYTRALRMELLPRGIKVTAVCPWWVADTEFLSVAKDNAANPDSVKSIRSFVLPSKKEAVVRRALRASRMGFAVSTPGIMCFLHRIFSKLIPRTGMLYLWELMRRIG